MEHLVADGVKLTIAFIVRPEKLTEDSAYVRDVKLSRSKHFFDVSPTARRRSHAIQIWYRANRHRLIRTAPTGQYVGHH